ncbi:MAG: ferritin family protein [bacterium]|nr:MAG: ferritin family protein [bacterium]
MTKGKLNLKEIIEMAIQIETAGAAFYGKLREMASSREVGELFQHLESAEHQHIRDFKRIFKESMSRIGQMEYATTEEDLLYLRAFASRRIFSSPEDAVRKAERLTDPLEAIDMSMDFELRSVGFYREMADRIEDPSDRAAVGELVKQEKGHAAQLYRMRERMKGEG